MYKIYLFFIMIFTCSLIRAQQENAIIAEYHDIHGLSVSHVISQGETIFSIAQFYGSALHSVENLNNGIVMSSIVPGQSVIFNLSNDKLGHSQDRGLRIPVYYRIKKEETMYKIARVIAEIEVEGLMRLNNKKDYNLVVGETLCIGYLGRVSSPDSPITGEDHNMAKAQIQDGNINSLALFTQFSQEDDGKITDNQILSESITVRGIAAWDNYKYEGSDFLAMHTEARPNTEISLYNPMLKRLVKATVVGQIPVNSYPDNISVVISPSVANALGALDRQFLIEMTYIK